MQPDALSKLPEIESRANRICYRWWYGIHY